IGSDAVSLTGGTGAFANKNAGTGKSVTVSGATLTGADAPNYSLGAVTANNAEITARHVTGTFTAGDKVYDATVAAMIATRYLVGTIGGDSVSLSGGMATFSDKTVANGKTVTLAGATLTGGDAGNYVLDSVATTTANITALHI